MSYSRAGPRDRCSAHHRVQWMLGRQQHRGWLAARWAAIIRFVRRSDPGNDVVFAVARGGIARARGPRGGGVRTSLFASGGAADVTDSAPSPLRRLLRFHSDRRHETSGMALLPITPPCRARDAARSGPSRRLSQAYQGSSRPQDRVALVLARRTAGVKTFLAAASRRWSLLQEWVRTRCCVRCGGYDVRGGVVGQTAREARVLRAWTEYTVGRGGGSARRRASLRASGLRAGECRFARRAPLDAERRSSRRARSPRASWPRLIRGSVRIGYAPAFVYRSRAPPVAAQRAGDRNVRAADSGAPAQAECCGSSSSSAWPTAASSTR